MMAGFGGLLFLIVAIGLIGIQQIQGLSKVIGDFANQDMPLQNAVLEMKSANSKYGMGIRSYMFWQNTKFLDAAAEAANLDRIDTALKNFDAQLDLYASTVSGARRRAWVETIRSAHKELEAIGKKVIALTDRSGSALPEEKKKLTETINKEIMDFENKLFRLDAFLDDPLQRFNRDQIERRLAIAESDKERAFFLLSCSLAIGLGLGVQTAFLIYRRSKEERRRREFLWRKVIRVEEEERNNLSFQIHDQMGQDLSGLKIFLGLIDRELPSEMREPKEKIEKTKKIVDDLMAKTHNISELLRPPELDDLGLVESIASLIGQYQEMTGAQYRYLRPSAELKVSSEHSLLLYRVAQESLTNISKYSQAKNVEISLQREEDAVYLSVTDDGVGFDYDAYLNRPMRRKEDKLKLGLQGLRERIELLDGTLTVTTMTGQGTKLAVMLPA